MDLFKNRIQPTIVHLGENETLSVSNKYFLNYNVVQIDWFKNNSIVLEDGTGILLLETAKIDNPLTASSNDIIFALNDPTDPDTGVLDLPRIYFLINDNFITSTGTFITPDVINSLIISLLQLSDDSQRNTVSDLITSGNIYEGITLIPGRDYFINTTFANYLVNIDLNVADESSLVEGTELYNKVQTVRGMELPNYLKDNSDLQEPWVQLTEHEINNTDFEYYYELNIVNNYSITEDDILNFYPTFCRIILDANADKTFIDIENIRYKAVLEYFANSKNDATLQGINLILGGAYTGQIANNTASLYSNCKCNSSSSEITSCLNIYQESMLEYLKQMLGSDNFYYNWLFINKEPNKDLIRCLKYLISQFVSLGLDLSFNSSNTYCSCKTADNSKSESNYAIINKYNKVLSWVRACEIPYNINKIKVYGSQFGELLPKLQF